MPSVASSTRMGASAGSSDIETTTQSVLPYDAERATLADIADDLAVLGAWFWGIGATGAGAKKGRAGSWGMKTWLVENPKQPIRLLPQERYTHVVYSYRYGSDHYAQAAVATTTWAFPAGYRREFLLDMEEPPPQPIAGLFAQKVADFLGIERRSGRRCARGGGRSDDGRGCSGDRGESRR